MRLIVTTSWDDGHWLDTKLLELLDKYDLKGNFYVSKNYLKDNRLTSLDICKISQNHEIGGHTINHPNLLAIPLNKVEEEIKESKVWLEDLIKKEVKTFCYPGGYFNKKIIQLVQKAGFKYARCTEKFVIEKPENRFVVGTSINIYPFPLRKRSQSSYYWRYLFQPFFQNHQGIRKINIPLLSLRSWRSLAKSIFDCSLKKGQVFHLWGHSWEIEKYGMWEELENFFRYIAHRKDCIYLTNGETLEYV